MKQSIIRYYRNEEVLVDMSEAKLEAKARSGAYITVLRNGIYLTVKASELTKEVTTGGFWR